jgi:hypothetical protein
VFLIIFVTGGAHLLRQLALKKLPTFTENIVSVDNFNGAKTFRRMTFVGTTFIRVALVTAAFH